MIFQNWLDRFNDWILDEYRFIENVILENTIGLSKVNIKKLKQISIDMKDCLKDMEENIELYDISEEKY